MVKTVKPESKRKVKCVNTRGRRRKWTPQVLSNADKVCTESFKKDYLSDNKSKQNVVALFLEFVRINQLTIGEALCLWIGQQRRCRVAWSSIVTNLGYVSCLFRGPDRHYFTSAKKGADMAHADMDPTIVTSKSDAELLSLIEEVGVHDPLLATHLYLIFASGGRSRDISRLRRKQICRNGGRLTIEFRIMKNRRKRAHRFLLEVPKELYARIPDCVNKFLSRGNPKCRPFKSYFCASKVVSDLKKYSRKSRITTKTFRRAYVRRVRSFCKGDQENMKLFTGHFQGSTLNSFYQEWSGNVRSS